MTMVTPVDSVPASGTTPSRSPIHLIAGAVFPALVGLALALLMPRGPVTPGEAIMTMLVGAALGMASGWLLGRWAMLVAPLVSVAGFELGRIGFEAPSLEGVHLDSVFGIVLFVVTRGFHAALALLPMVWGAWIGSSAFRRAGAGKRLVEAMPMASTIALVLMISVASVAIARPAVTDPIVDHTGARKPGSVAELLSVELGDHRQEIMIRGEDRANPILLYLTGGPGNSDLGYTRAFLEELEEDFVLVAWEQRGVGKSYAAIDPVATLTLENAVTDLTDLTEYLIGRFDQDKIYLFGNSWGSILGVLGAQARPNLYHAYIGAGQMVSPLETDRALYRQMLDYADRIGDRGLREKMLDYGEPPYEDLYGYMTVIEHYSDLEPYTETTEFAAGPPGIQGTAASEYGFMDKLNVFRGLADMGGVMYPQIQGLDLRRDVPALEVPVFLVQGAHELTARGDLALDYASRLLAPTVRVEVFDNSGHVPHFEEAARFHRYLVDVVLAEIEGQG